MHDSLRLNPAQLSHRANIPSCLPLLNHILDERFAGFVRASDEWSACAIQEAHVQGALAPGFEDGRGHVGVDGHVAFGGLHVLAEGDDIGVDLAKFCWARFV